MTASRRTIRVFISSTFKDMQAERDHLVRFVFPKLREELLHRRIHLVDVDLRWGVTSEQDSLQVCKEIIDECRPRFLCMLGGRYGSTPPGQEESITAAEVHYGVLDRLGKHGYAFFYFRDPAATASMVEAQPGEFREPPGTRNERKLTELKSAITNAGLSPFIYSATWDDETRRLTGLKAFGDRVYADLMQSIDEELGKQPPEKLDEFAEENAAMEAFVEERTERFVLGSREPILKELLAHATHSGGNGYICLTGAPGSGKSALLAHLYRCLQTPALDLQPSLVIPHFVGASPGSTNMHRTLRRLCHELKEKCSDIIAQVPDNSEGLRDAFIGFLGQASAKNRVIIILDAVNQFDTIARSGGLRWLPERLPPNARVILSSLDGSTLEELRRRCNPPEDVVLRGLTLKDAAGILRQSLRHYGKRMSRSQRRGLLAKTDADKPLYLLAALEELRTLGTHEEITSRIAQLPPDTQALFIWILKRLEDDDGFRDAEGRTIGKSLVSHFASLVAVSRHGLSQRELTDLLDAGDPQGNVAALLHLLRSYLMYRGELLDFYHSQFRQAVAEKYLDTKESRQTYHGTLADYFCAREELTDRKVSEWPYQLARAENWTQLRDAITSPNLCMKLSGAGVNELWGYASVLPEFKGKLHDIVKDCPDRWQAELGETPDFELALNELGFQLCECGEKSAAQDLLDRACKLAQHMYGQDDIRTAIRLHNYAACLVMNEHKYKEALEILRKVVPSFAKHFREHDGNTIDAHISLGIAQYKSGDISHGMEELLSCEADSIRYLGEGHSSTVNAILAVGDAYGFTGEFEKAAEKSQKAAKLSERIQGTNHPYVDDLKERASRWARVVQLRLQAAAHEDSHRLGEALNSFEEMEAIGEAFAGEAVMAVSRFGKSRIRLLLGHTLEAARDIECAREFAQVGMPNLVQDIRDFISQREVLLSHIQNGDISNAVSDGHVARDLNNEAIELRNKGELARAEQLLRESLEIEIEQRGESHPKVAHRLNNLSSVLVLRNRLDEAKQLLARAWQLKVDQHDITSSRVLFIRLIVALLESESVSVFVGQLKVLLVQEYLRDYAGVAMKWNVTYLLEQFTSNLGERNIEFLTALAAVTNEHSKVSMLDCFPEWRGQSPVPLETPWSA